MTPFELAKFIDHTLLAPEATTQDVAKLCEEANAMKVAAVCISPSQLPIKSGLLSGEIALACVTGFPSGAHTAVTKAFEAANAVKHGATEIDMVINLGFVFNSMWLELGEEITSVRKSISDLVKLKVIIESAALTDEQIVMSCRVAVASGADFVKTSTGFHKAGGASVHAVQLMRATVGNSVGVKASGGIRTRESALEMIKAGASRLGTSATSAILAG